MFADDSCIYSGRNLFVLCSENRYQFYNLTGETPETCLQLVNFIDMQLARNSRLTVVNRVFLFLIWLRCYPTFATLAAMFNISTSIVQVIVWGLIRRCRQKLQVYIKWPTVAEWLSMRGRWQKVFPAVGAIVGTSHEIHRPMNEPQQ